MTAPRTFLVMLLLILPLIAAYTAEGPPIEDLRVEDGMIQFSVSTQYSFASIDGQGLGLSVGKLPGDEAYNYQVDCVEGDLLEVGRVEPGSVGVKLTSSIDISHISCPESSGEAERAPSAKRSATAPSAAQPEVSEQERRGWFKRLVSWFKSLWCEDCAEQEARSDQASAEEKALPPDAEEPSLHLLCQRSELVVPCDDPPQRAVGELTRNGGEAVLHTSLKRHSYTGDSKHLGGNTDVDVFVQRADGTYEAVESANCEVDYSPAKEITCTVPADQVPDSAYMMVTTLPGEHDLVEVS